VKTIYLNHGYKTIVDDDVYEWASKYVWRYCNGYAVRSSRKGDGLPKGSMIFLHREITGTLKDEQVDHIDKDELNNLRSNLRKCTQKQNLWNQKPRGGTSTFIGVAKHKGSKNWNVQIRTENGRKSIGTFITEKEAAKAYDREALNNRGEFATLNFPEKIEEYKREEQEKVDAMTRTIDKLIQSQKR